MKHRFSRGDLKRLILPLFFEQLLVMLVADALITVFRQLGNHVKGIVWGEGVWQKGEMENTPAMDEAFLMGQSV